MSQPKNNLNLQQSVLWSALTIILLFVSSVLFHQYKYAFHSDDAIKTVLGRLAYADGSLVPKNWVYANGDILLLSPYVFSILIYPLIGISYLSNAISTWIAYLFLVLAVYFSCQKIAGRPRAALISTIISAAGVSAANFEYVVAQGAYSMYAAVAVCTYAMVASCKFLDKNVGEAKKRVGISLFGFVISAWSCVSNPTRGVVTITLPVVMGWIAFIVFSGRAIGWARLFAEQYRSIASIIAGSVAGTLLFKYAIYPNILNYDAAAKFTFAPHTEILSHLSNTPTFWFEYFQIWGAWSSLSLVLRALQFAIWLVAGALIVLPIYTIVTFKKRSPSLTCLAWILLASYAITFSAMVTSPTLLSSPLDIRYVTFPVYGSICMFGIYADEFASRHKTYGKILLAGLIVVGLSSAQQWRNEYKPDSISSGNSSYTQRISLIKLLEANNVGTILTTYWNSHVITVLSNGSVDAYPVGIGSQLKPFAHHMPRRIFYGRAGAKQAVVLSEADLNSNTWRVVEYQLGKPYEKLSVGPFTAWIYNKNITERALQIGSEVDSAIQPSQVQVSLSQLSFEACHVDSGCRYQIDAVNIGHHVLGSVGFRPMRLGIHGVDSSGNIIIQDAGRADFPVALKPGDSAHIDVKLPKSSNPRVSGYRLCLLQEGVNWLCGRTQSQSSHLR